MNPHILTTSMIEKAVQVNAEAVRLRLGNLALCLLTDQEGVSEKSWFALLSLCRKVDGPFAISLSRAVEATDGRWYIPETRIKELVNGDLTA